VESEEGEQFIDQPPFNFPIEPKPIYRAYVTGRVTGMATGGTTRHNGFRQFELAKHDGMAPKRRSLLFAVSTDVPAPYMVYWKVRNGGVEAAQQHVLRGEITPDAGAHAKEETTSYTGMHYVECYVVKDGTVVARLAFLLRHGITLRDEQDDADA
jgi:adenylyl/guanylyl cyclase-like protein with sensor domain